MSLQVATASFASTPADGTLTASRQITPVSTSFRAYANFIYRKNTDVTFVGANTSASASVVVPSHQPLDLLIVFAVNGSGTGNPLVPSGEGWTEIHYGGAMGSRVAYKFAQTNSEVAGIWAGATRTTIAVYRNVRAVVKTTTSSTSTFPDKILYPNVYSNQSSGGSRLIAFSASENLLDPQTAPSGFTSRTSTAAIGEVAPGVGLHDRLAPTGAAALQTFSIDDVPTSADPGKQIAFGVLLASGRPQIVQPTIEYESTLNGTAIARTLFVRSKRLEANLTEFLFLYRQFLDVETGSFSYSVSSPTSAKGFYLLAETAEFTTSVLDITTVRALRYGWPGIAVTPYLLTGDNPTTDLGFFINPQNGGFSATWASIGLRHSAIVIQTSTGYQYEFDATFIRTLIEAFTGNTFGYSLSEVGLRNDGVSYVAGKPTGLPPALGGSDPSGPTFMRPAFVRYGSVNQSRDLGVVSNFFGEFTGEIGSQVGTNTIYFKLETIGPADLLVKRNAVNKYTDRFVSINVLDANRKLVEVNDFGFAYNNEVVNTPGEESLSSLPAGVYYFSISTDQWQAVPYSVTIQAIRFIAIDGAAQISAALAGRFAIAKLRGGALLTAPLVSSVPPFDTIIGTTGAIIVSSGSRGQLVIPSGVAVGRMLPSGRLKKTHKIGGIATGSMPNVATLSSQPPYGGYGG
tara:strand:+ start:22663 stop:24720 length:2058 start_codon:yes stop_codon:yes gene_type:complete